MTTVFRQGSDPHTLGKKGLLKNASPNRLECEQDSLPLACSFTYNLVLSQGPELNPNPF